MEDKSLKKSNLAFEDAIKELEKIVEELEKGDVSLEKSLDLYKRGVELTNLCNHKLTEAQGVVRILSRNSSGELQETEFDIDEKGTR
ncbi:MAG: exodeoxyribonuclease VII small subunit [Clostridiales bacterium]|nr:exodeoxyribonuclease VII small subunit [Clostridiales bacterium]